MSLKALIRQLILDERGQSTTEYILILSVVVMVALKFKEKFQNQLTGIVDKLGADIQGGINNPQ